MAVKLIIRVSLHLLAEAKPCLYAYSVGRDGAKTFIVSFQKLFIYLFSCVSVANLCHSCTIRVKFSVTATLVCTIYTSQSTVKN